VKAPQKLPMQLLWYLQQSVFTRILATKGSLQTQCYGLLFAHTKKRAPPASSVNQIEGEPNKERNLRNWNAAGQFLSSVEISDRLTTLHGYRKT